MAELGCGMTDESRSGNRNHRTQKIALGGSPEATVVEGFTGDHSCH
jgi:hypothetical protein